MKGRVKIFMLVLLAALLAWVAALQKGAYANPCWAQNFSPDTDFKAWLTQLNGARWLIIRDQVTGTHYYELNGDILSEYIYKSGARTSPFSVKLEKRNFIHTYTGGDRSIFESSYEISEDGEFITKKIIRNDRFPNTVGTVTKYHRIRETGD